MSFMNKMCVKLAEGSVHKGAQVWGQTQVLWHCTIELDYNR